LGLKGSTPELAEAGVALAGLYAQISERQGTARKKKYKAKPKVDDNDIKKAVKMYHTKRYTVKEIETLTGVSKNTLYQRLKTIAAD
jgi:hypothetical protein